MQRIFLLALLFFITIFGLNAQNQGNIWYFGSNAGLDFNSGSPVALTNGQLNTTEGCASICDISGNLLFYTDGSTIYDRTHTAMPNGNGLLGNGSSSQSGAIVPKPGNPNIYYVFTSPVNSADGLNYSEVDMTLNGGNGDVNGVKNVLLIQPICEKVAAVTNASGNGAWVVTHGVNNNEYYAFEVTAAGVNTTPVTSAVGQVVTSQTMGIGYLKFSSECKMASAYHNPGASLEILEFDNGTGIITNPILLTSFGGFGPYGVEFSNSGQYLYVADGSSVMHQLDVSNFTQAAVAASQFTFPALTDDYWALQMGPDGVIYATGNGYAWLSGFTQPDMAGMASNPVDSLVYLGGRTGRLGLPTAYGQYIQSCSLGLFGFISSQNFCDGDSTLVNASSNGDSVLINFGDPSSGVANISKKLQNKHLFSAPGFYNVTMFVFLQGVTDTFYHQITIDPVPSIDLGDDIFLCPNEKIEISAYQPIPGLTYLWDDSTTSAFREITETGYYYVRAQLNACEDWDTIYVEVSDGVFNGFELKIDERLPLCYGDTVVLNGYHPNTLGYSWQDSSITESTFTVSGPGTYYVELFDTCEIMLFPITIEYVICDTPDICNVLVGAGAFSPNRDGLNDYFRVKTQCPVTNFQMEVYNRWGAMVYGTNNINDKGWNGSVDGSQSEVGDYVWFVRFTDKDNFSYTEKGVVTLIR